MPQIGTVDLPFDVGESWSQERGITERNYVGSPPTVTEFERSLESGDLNFVLHQGIHSRSETLDEQADGAYFLLEEDAAYHPFDYLGNRGHLAIESVGVNQDSRLNLREGSMTIRYLPDALYNPTVEVAPSVVSNDHNVSANGTIALPATASSVRHRNIDTGETSSVTSTATVTTTDGDIDIYDNVDGHYLFEAPSTYHEIVSRAPVQTYAHNSSSTESDWTRLYRKFYTEELVIENGLTRLVFNDPSDGNHHLYLYNGSSWLDVGHLDLNAPTQTAEAIGTEKVDVKIDDGTVSLERGGTTIGINFSGRSSMTLDTSTGDYPIGSFTDNTSYFIGGNSSISEDYIIIKPSSDGTFNGNTTSGVMEVTSLSSTTTYNLYFGFVPSALTGTQVRDWSMTEDNRDRELTHRRIL